MNEQEKVISLDDSLAKMTAYCTYCPKMCRFTCPAAKGEGRETVTPWGMMRLAELTRDGSVELDAEIANTFYHCTGCRRCQAFCKHDNDVPQVLVEVRAHCVDVGLLPEPLIAMEADFQRYQSGYGEAALEGGAAIDLSSFDPSSRVAFWPDCTTVARFPKRVAQIGRLMERALGEKVRLIRAEETLVPPCCGFPRQEAGTLSKREHAAFLQFPLAGLQAVYTDCPSLASLDVETSSFAFSDEQKEDRPAVKHLFSFFVDHLEQLGPPSRSIDLSGFTLHQSCFHARQIEDLDHIQTLLAHLSSQDPKRGAFADKESICCGGTMVYRRVDKEGSLDGARNLLRTLGLEANWDSNKSTHDDTQGLVTTSATCQCAIAKVTSLQVRSLLDLLLEAYEGDASVNG